MIHRLTYILIVFVSISSCKKNDNDSLKEQRTSLLVNTKWNLISSEQSWVDDNGDTLRFDDISSFPEHTRDNYIVFSADNTFHVDDNGIKNPEGSTGAEDGKWRLSDAGTELVFDNDKPGIDNFTWEVVSITASSLKLSNLANTVTTTTIYSAVP